MAEVFEDRVQDIIKWEGQDQVVFKITELTPLTQISGVRCSHPPELTYTGKPV